MSDANQNPKMRHSGMLDCIPQVGKCPVNCPDCFYNKGFYLDIDKDLPLIPTPEEAEGYVVRCNSGHDSALQKDLVLETAKQYKDCFFNTSRLDTNFPGPVVVTVNPSDLPQGQFHHLDPSPNLMFVRARVDIWDPATSHRICDYYSKLDVPIVLTFMRYSREERIPPRYRHNFQKRVHIKNSYYSLTNAQCWDRALSFISSYPRTYYCGNPHSSYCSICGNCIREYFSCRERMKQDSKGTLR